MKKIEYKLKDRYAHKITDRSDDPEYTKKVTVPGQTISLKELIQRHKQGRPIPGGMYEEPGEGAELKAAVVEDADYDQAFRVDPLTARDEVAQELNQISQAKAERKAKAEAAKKEAKKKEEETKNTPPEVSENE